MPTHLIVRTSAQGSPSPTKTSSIKPFVSMIRLRISSSLAPSDAKHRNAPTRGSGDVLLFSKSNNELIK